MSAIDEASKREAALKRWRHLGQMLANRKCRVDGGQSNISVRRFASFGLLKTKLLPDEKDVAEGAAESSPAQHHLWYNYSCDIGSNSYTAKIRYLDGTISIDTLLGFNNTGNVCVWPSEEILTYFCLQRLSYFKGKTVCEIGGGMTCLAGMFLGIHGDIDELLLTDGNDKSMQNVEAIVKKNESLFGDTTVHSSVLKWNDDEKLEEWEGRFDMIICADCLFFDDVALDLICTIERLLKPQGEAIIFAPTRGETFMKFKDMALRRFSVTFTKQYDRAVLDLHTQNLAKEDGMYDENLHYPLLLQLRKPDNDDEEDSS